MSKQNLIVGKTGEELAAAFLKAKGYRILVRNYKTKLGEIDIIAQDRGVICFVEVKTRNSAAFGSPQEALTKSKQVQIARAALLFLKEKNLFGKRARFDVVSVLQVKDNPRIDLLRNAFELDSQFT